MENHLRARGLWSMLEEGYAETPEGVEVTAEQQKLLEDLKMKDHQVKHYLFIAIDRVEFEQILDWKMSKSIWRSMKKKFRGNERVKRSLLQNLRRDFEILSMKKDENVEDYIGRVMTISNKIKKDGEKMPDSKIVENILRTLTDKFTYVVVSIEESQNTASMTIDEVQSSLSVYVKNFKRISYEKDDQALNVGGRGIGSFRGRGRGRGRLFNKAVIECYKCHKLGNFQYECPTANNGTYYTEIEENEEVLLMAHIELQALQRGDIWFVNSGCSNHFVEIKRCSQACTHNSLIV